MGFNIFPIGYGDFQLPDTGVFKEVIYKGAGSCYQASEWMLALQKVLRCQALLDLGLITNLFSIDVRAVARNK